MDAITETTKNLQLTYCNLNAIQNMVSMSTTDYILIMNTKLDYRLNAELLYPQLFQSCRVTAVNMLSSYLRGYSIYIKCLVGYLLVFLSFP